MGYIIKQEGKDLYIEDEYDGKILWTEFIMDAKVFLTELHATDIARLARVETEII